MTKPAASPQPVTVSAEVLPGRDRNAAPEPKPVEDQSNAAMLALLRVEADARRAASQTELVHLIANETRKLVRARQVFVMRRVRGHNFRIEAISSIDIIDRNTPLVGWIERIAQRLAKDVKLEEPREFALPAYCDAADAEAATYPFRNFLWVPMKLRDDTVFAGILLAREQVWLDADSVVIRRLSGCFSHAWSALVGNRRLQRSARTARFIAPLAAVAIIAAMAIPVPMSALAPAQVVPKDAFVVAAPIDGIVSKIATEPNSRVAIGDSLVLFDDVRLRNEFALATSQVEVANAKLKQASQAAFADTDARRELRLAISELELRQAELAYAEELLSKVTVKAEQPGVAVFSSPREWIGRPVKTGERIMEIADPDNVELQIDLPVADALLLKAGAAVKLYADADPLKPIAATVVHASHEASEDDSGVLSYRLTAKLDDAEDIPRIGMRGTAQVYGEKAALFYYLFRRPISSLRQHFGL
jgi:multidrug resistance efflux pump